MKFFLILFLSLFILSCSKGGESETPDEPGLPSETINISLLKAQQNIAQIPLLVIQVDFNDQTIAQSETAWSQQLFGTAQGQLNHYFLQTSQNSFSFSPATESFNNVNDGIIKVHLNNNHPDPANGVNNFDVDIAIPAISIADTYINFLAYDTNGNFLIDKNELQVMFLVAGGEQATGLHPGIWAHMFCINGQIHDDVSVMQCDNGSYTAFGERHFAFGATGNDATIGIMAHELGHGVFYLPDLYDVDGSSEGIGNFGLMGTGLWGYKSTEDPGERPVHMSAWSKHQSGFLTESTLSINGNNIPINETGFSSYQTLKVKTQEPNEYFLIENRSRSGYDAGMFILDGTTFQGGLAIWHIDESQVTNANENNKLVDLEEADSFHLDTNTDRGNQTNLFYAGNTSVSYTGELTPISTPATSNLYSGASTNIFISNISVPSSIMYIDLHF